MSYASEPQDESPAAARLIATQEGKPATPKVETAGGVVEVAGR